MLSLWGFVIQRDTFYFYTLSIFWSLYSYLSKEVESVLLLLPETSFFYTGICTSTRIDNVSTLATSEHNLTLTFLN